ncbi:MAG TPA: protein-L-isoaspartate(D-aspartate) O-methyltransferase [Spirochaetia bacterium]|nr:protein-L-isoaspartate(D-aspartate) O-methyltransferase [Spirochaetia bacterium]
MVKLQVENRDITDERVLDALRTVPRHAFVPQGSRATAYGDFPVPIGHGQTISQPYMVAFMTQALRLTGTEKVLEIGTGSGYQTAILAVLAANVYTVERIPALSASAEKALGLLGFTNVFFRTGDGGPGWPEQAPFDRILVTAAAPSVPTQLRGQLADNGILVVPVGDWRRSQVLVTVRRTGGSFVSQESIGCRFVPLIGEGGFAL